MDKMATPFEYVFPGIRGIQAGREYFVSMCPLRLIPRIFLFNEVEMAPELRAQRHLNRSRVPEIARYISKNTDTYVFSALTASLDADVQFEPYDNKPGTQDLGVLRIPMSAKFIINDGQHRRAAIEMALEECPEIADETIAVVFFIDRGLKRCQQMFADLNRYAIRPSRSLGVLYDHRDDKAELVRMVVMQSPLFKELVELEKSNLSPRSKRLFTLSALYTATAALLADSQRDQGEERAELALEYWAVVAKQFPEWEKVRRGHLSAGEVRQDFIHSHGVVIHALGRVGNTLLSDGKRGWKAKIGLLRSIDWRRSNTTLWEGRVMVGGRISKSHQHVILTTNAIKQHLEIPLTVEEERVESEFKARVNGD